MPISNPQKQSFPDPLKDQFYGTVIIEDTIWGNIAGAGTPEDLANVTGDHIFRQATDPTPTENALEGDYWIDTSDDNHPYKYVEGVWTSVRDAGAGADTPGTGKWTHDLVFSVTDSNTVAWGSGTITLTDGGGPYTIDAGNTGDMAAITYIFLDATVSSTVLQTTTTASSSVGANRILIAVAKQNSDTDKDADYQVFGGFGQNVFITADNIAAETITFNEIAGNTITAAKMDVSQLSAISADLGTITAGSISVAALPTAPGDDVIWARWGMDEGSGTSLIDLSANARTGTLVNTPTYSAGKVGGALTFAGTAYVSLPSTSMPTTAITVSAWVKVTSHGSSRRIIWNTWSAAGDWIMYSDATNWIWGVRDGSNTQQLVVSAHGSDTGWHHLCGTYDGATQRFYVDGIEVGTPVAFAVALTTGGTFRMSHDAFDTLIGSLDEVRIYSTAASVYGVRALYVNPSLVTSNGIITAKGGLIGGWTIGASDLSATSGGNTTILSSGATAFSAGPTGTPSVTITQAGVLTATGATITGGLNSTVTFTADRAVLAGDLVAVSSTDTVRRIGFSAWGTFGTETTATTNSPTANKWAWRSVDLDTELKIVMWANSSEQTEINQIKIDADAGTITSITNDNDGELSSTSIDVCKVSTSAIIIGYVLAGAMKAKVISSLDTTRSVGAQQSITGTNAAEIQTVYIDDSNVLFFYRNTSDEKIYLEQCTRSGDTITSVTNTAVWTNTDTKVLHSVRRVGTTNYMAILVQNTTVGEAQVICGLYDTTNKNFSSIGSEAGFSGEDLATGVNKCELISFDDTTMGVAYGLSGSTTVKARVIGLSGTTVTVNSAVTLTGALMAANNGVSQNALNARTMGVSFRSALTLQRFILLELDSTKTTLVATNGSNGNTSLTNNNQIGGAIFRVNPLQLLTGQKQNVSASVNDSFSINSMAHNYDTYVGVPTANIAASASGSVIVSGVSSTISSLTAATKYYQEFGGLVTTDSNGSARRAGIAKDTNEFIVTI